jgi:hypothetical protein
MSEERHPLPINRRVIANAGLPAIAADTLRTR